MKFLARKADQWKQSQLGKTSSVNDLKKTVKLDIAQNETKVDLKLDVLLTKDTQIQTNMKSATRNLTRNDEISRNSNNRAEERQNRNREGGELVAQQLFSYNFEPLRKQSECRSKATSVEPISEQESRVIISNKPRRQNSVTVTKPVIQKILNLKEKAIGGSFVQSAVSVAELTSRDMSSACLTARSANKKFADSFTYHNLEKLFGEFPFGREIADTVNIQKLLNYQKSNTSKLMPKKHSPEKKRQPIAILGSQITKQKVIEENRGMSSTRQYAYQSLQGSRKHSGNESTKYISRQDIKPKIGKPAHIFMQRISKESASSRSSSHKNLRKLSEFDLKSITLKRHIIPKKFSGAFIE